MAFAVARLLPHRLARRTVTSLQSRSFHASQSANMARILFSDRLDPVCKDVFEEQGHTVDIKTELSEDELCKIVGDYDGLVVRSSTQVTERVLRAGSPQLRLVGRAGTGVDNIDVSAASRQGVIVMNTPGGNAQAAAELAAAHMLALARSVPQAAHSMKAHRWDRKKYSGVELGGKTLGIVGFGRVGQILAKRAVGLGMQVLAFDPLGSEACARELGVSLCPLYEVLRGSDFLSLHVPRTEETENLLGREALAMCRPGVRVINCARGGVVDEQALLEALQSGQVAGAAMDVFETEPPGEQSRALIEHPRVICTPHLGASTHEAQRKVAEQIALQMCDILENRQFVGVVNAKHMQMAANADLQPFIGLCLSLGRTAAQIVGEPIRQVQLFTRGGRDIDVTQTHARATLQAAVLQGVMEIVLQKQKEMRQRGTGGGGGRSSTSDGTGGDEVTTQAQPDVVPNLVNAPALAEAAGISQVQASAPRASGRGSSLSLGQPSALPPLSDRCASFTNLVGVTVVTEGGQRSFIAGAVLGQQGMIVQMEQFTDFPIVIPEGNLLLFRQQDKPGAVSRALGVLGERHINVAGVRIARQKSTSDALSVLTVDGAIDEDTLSALNALPDIFNVKSVRL